MNIVIAFSRFRTTIANGLDQSFVTTGPMKKVPLLELTIPDMIAYKNDYKGFIRIEF